MDIHLEISEIASEEPQLVVRHVARAFYLELRRHGLTDLQVLQVASGLLSCLNETLVEYRERLTEKNPLGG